MVFWIFFWVAFGVGNDAPGLPWANMLEEPLPRTARLEITECIYRAEVQGETEKSLGALRDLLGRHDDAAWRRSIVRAMAVIKHTATPDPVDIGEPERILSSVRAVWVTGHQRAVLLDQGWFELGDWLGERFLLDIDFTQAVLENPNQSTQTVAWPEAPVQDAQPPGLLAWGVDPSRMLTFIARQGGYNSFVPSALGPDFAGFFAADDWWICLHLACHELEVSWIRHGDNIVFRAGRSDLLDEDQSILTVDRHDMELAEFLQIVANQFDMELVLLDPLDGLVLDVQLVNQTWSETLDCLAMMNRLHWFIVPRDGEKTRLVIDKE